MEEMKRMSMQGQMKKMSMPGQMVGRQGKMVGRSDEKERTIDKQTVQ